MINYISPPENRFMTAIRNGEKQFGLWLGLTSNLATEVIGAIGFDWLVIDAEHAPNEMTTLLPQLQALRGAHSEPVVRATWNDPVLIKRYMDIGFRTILFPYVQNKEEAEAAVAAMRYPPEGVRGVATVQRAASYGADASYIATSNERACALLQVETGTAINCIEEIASVKNLGGIFIGPSDLAASMGHLGNPAHEEVQAAMKHAADVCKAKGVPIGTLAPVSADAKRYLEWGYTFIALGAEAALMRTAATQKLAEFKDA
ncbi:aldolase/citrate lyase family protein [uncultured Cohaesibacter sp.]|uniref:aldolase/citrate lyase family protein n=1 Tax=uncultured Cohaesibacter sp. TaxID=1002546 RepID=UPI0029C625F1|nr:aldolase/citrate lyase family protein [uncultured Cohaesibacter sp.]